MLLSRVVLVISALLSTAVAVIAAPPRATVTDLRRDLGLRVPGAAAEAVFTVRNGGGEPLALMAGRARGGPAVVTIEGSPVAPGGEARLRVVVDTWAFDGPVTVTVPVSTTDPETPVLKLEVVVDVQAAVVVEPGFARFIYVQDADEGTVPQVLRAVDGATFRVTEARSPESFLRVTIAGPNTPATTQKVEVTLLPDAPVGPLGAMVSIAIDHPRQKEVRLPVSGFVRPVFAATPPEVVLDEVAPGHATSVGVRTFLDAPFTLGPVESDMASVAAEVEEEGVGAWTMRVTVAADAPAGPLAGTLRIRTSSPSRPVIEVPFKAQVVRP